MFLRPQAVRDQQAEVRYCRKQAGTNWRIALRGFDVPQWFEDFAVQLAGQIHFGFGTVGKP